MSDYLHKPIFITGLPRSGTSLVAGLFTANGAWSGTTVPGNDANPKGYFEHGAIREQVVKGILNQMKADPLGVRVMPSLNPVMGIKNLDKILTGIIKQDGYTGNQPWLYKDAKLSLIWPFFYNAFPEAQWIIVRRPLERVIDSCLNTSFIKQHSTDRAFWNNFAESYQQRLQQLEATAANVTEIDIETIFDQDYTPLQQLIEQCGLSYQQQAIDNFVDRQHWHYPKETSGS
jgi:hypothetical protein